MSRLLLMCAAPLEWGFRGGVIARGAWYDARGGSRAPLPVISVGNLTVGGAGKTPMLRALWEWIETQGTRAALVTRGYGADEVALYRKWFGVDRVFVSPSRIEGVRRANAKGLDLALIDDGFQHRALARDLDLLLIAAEDPFPVHLLPRGPYRESLRAAARASMILITNRTGSADGPLWQERLGRVAPRVPVSEITLGGRGWVDLRGARRPAPSGDILAVASTASPWAFTATVAQLSPEATVELLSFPDHHEYMEGDVAHLLRSARGRMIATTEKDAVKLAAFPEMRARCRVVEFGVIDALPESLTTALAGILQAAR